MELSVEIGALTKVGMGSHQDSDRSSRNSSSGSSTSEKSRMLDITRDKPVKVAVRVAVPVRDHPKFNFVGKLLGPKGNSMKRLQEETMCKMAVLGRGSMKDRKKEEELRLSGDPRYSHLLEDLHVEISTFAAPAEAHARIAYALSEVRRFLVPDYYDDIRQEQMWEMQALNTTQTPLDSTNSILNCGILGDQNFMTQVSPNNDNNDIRGDQQTLNNENTNGKSCESIMQIDGHHPNEQNLGIQTTQLKNSIGNPINTCTTTIAANSVNSYTIQGLNGPPNITSIVPNHNSNMHQQHLTNSGVNLTPNNDIETKTVTLFETPLLHPALRGVKTVNIASGLARKRPLLGVPRSNMNPTKRTVMTLLARARNAQALYNARAGLAAAITEPMQMITSPLLLQPQLDVIQHANGSMTTIPKENILQGA